MTLEAVSGTIATLLGIVFIWPQVVRVYARQSVEGIAANAHLIGLAGTPMWFTYAITTDSVPMMLSNLNIEIAIIALMVMLVRKKAIELWKPVVVFSATAIFCATIAYISPTIVGVAGVIIGTPAILPQVWRAVRTKQLFGVSATSNVLLASMGAGWFTYGLSIGDPVVSYPNLVLIPSASYIAWKAWRSHHVSQLQPSVSHVEPCAEHA
ncbi:MAG: PQ-loop repeat-containing protein [Actinobacteria bacterium]|nr:PQ-loop repeat-containing protein [Actinomycetota bacterium]